MDSERPPIHDLRILITGGAGFIGSHIAEALAPENDVVILDNLSTGSRENVPPDVTLVEADIREYDRLSEVMNGVDLVFHHAAVVSVEQSVEDPLSTQEVNAQATVQLLEYARRESVRVVFASSAAVYGHPESVPISESAPTNPTSPYGLTKLTAERYCRLYAELYDLDTVALRYFNVYGPRQTAGDYSGVISIFMKQARTGGPITVHGDGSQTRDFVHVDDVVRANIAAAVRGESGSVYNVGTGESISISELAELIRELTPTNDEIDISYTSGRTGDIEQSRSNVERLSSELDILPKVELQSGLAELIES